MKKKFNEKGAHTHTYVDFLFPGTVFAEHKAERVRDRDVDKLTFPKDAYGFYFFDLTSATVDGEELVGKRKNESKIHIFADRILTLEDVKRDFPDQEQLHSNMKNNHRKLVARTIQGNFQPVNPDVVVINKDRKVIFPTPDVAEKQARLDNLMTKGLSKALKKGLGATVAWVGELVALANDPVTKFDDNGFEMSTALGKAGYKGSRGGRPGITDDKPPAGDKEAQGRNVVTQLLNCLDWGNPPDPAIKGLIEQYEKTPGKPTAAPKTSALRKTR